MGFQCSGSVTKNSKNSLPVMPLRSPDAGVLRIQHDLQGPDVNRIDSGMFFTETLFLKLNH